MKPGLFNIKLFDATVISENSDRLGRSARRRAARSARLRRASRLTGHDNFQDSNDFISQRRTARTAERYSAAGNLLHQPAAFQSDSRIRERSQTGRSRGDRFERRQRPRRRNSQSDGGENPRTTGTRRRRTSDHRGGKTR